MKKYSVIFFGTHRFAAGILGDLLDSPLVETCTVITQPDKPVGRKQESKASPVKELSLLRNLEILEPESLKNFKPVEKPYDFFIVAQYGNLIPDHLLRMPKFGTINVHTSLLPKYRGASPIQSAILQGDTKTGVTIMLMDEGLDTGPILCQKQIEIEEHDRYQDVEAKLLEISGKLLIETIVGFASATIKPQKQLEADATFCKKITKEDGQVDWSASTKKIYNLYRAYSPWPGVWTRVNGKRLKLIAILPYTDINLPYGKMTFVSDKIYIGTRDGSIMLKEIQLEGKNKMTAAEFTHGYASLKDTVMESSHNLKTK